MLLQGVIVKAGQPCEVTKLVQRLIYNPTINMTVPFDYSCYSNIVVFMIPAWDCSSSGHTLTLPLWLLSSSILVLSSVMSGVIICVRVVLRIALVMSMSRALLLVNTVTQMIPLDRQLWLLGSSIILCLPILAAGYMYLCRN